MNSLILAAMISTLAIDAKVPVLTYHSWDNRYDEATESCDVESEALLRDLKVIYEEGYTVIPAYWLAEWVRGWRSGLTLPAKSVVITLDDGYDLDYLDNIDPSHLCAPLRSVRSVLEEAATWDWSAPEGMPVPHVTTFVIASPAARSFINTDQGMSENWWPSANNHPLMELQSHGLDHDHESIPAGTLDERLSDVVGIDIFLPAGGDEPQMNSVRIDNYAEASVYVGLASEYIASRLGTWPDLFAYPFGPASDYMINIYMPTQYAEHGVVAAFCAGGEYVTRNSNIYCLGRFIHRAFPQYGGWRNEEELKNLLRKSQ